MAAAVEANGVIHALLVQKEATYSGSVTFDSGSDGDGILVRELPEFTINYQHDGARPTPQGTEGKQRRNPPTGRTFEASIITEFAGLELVYSASMRPPQNALIEAAGFSGSNEGNSVLYKRNSLDQAFSVAVLFESRDTLRRVAGAYADFEWGFGEPGEVGLATFNLVGLVTRPTSSNGTLIDDVVYGDPSPPRAVDVSLTINGDATLKVRSANFVLGRDVSTPRLDANSADGHCGFAVGEQDAMFTCVVEAVPDDFDAYLLREDGTEFAASITIGEDVGNIYSFSFPTCQIVEVNEQLDGPVAMWELVISIHNSNPGNRDDIQITFS